MNKLFTSVLFLGLISLNLIAQESINERFKEIYLSGNLLTFNNFGLQYKSEMKNGNYLRIGVTDLNFIFTKSHPASSSLYNSLTTGISGAFDIGIEKRKQLTNKLVGFYGISVTASTDFQRSKTENPTLPKNLRYTDDLSISPGLGFNSGFILNIFNDFFIAAELTPKLYYTYSFSQQIQGSEKVKSTINSGILRFNNKSILISLVYRWTK
jgi:hypothetical protein